MLKMTPVIILLHRNNELTDLFLIFLEKVEAFVAMGGRSDGKGTVDARKLLDVVKEEFQMTIDIEVSSS